MQCSIESNYILGAIAIGIGATSGDWLARPTLLPALLYGIATVVFPFFIMQPSLGLGIAASRTPEPNPEERELMKPGRGYRFLVGLSLGAAIWLLSPLVTGQREPWDAEGGYYVGTLLGAGILGGLAGPTHWGSTTLGVFVGQALVLLGGVLAEPASGGLWPLGLIFLGFYSILALFGTGVGATLRRLQTRRKGSRTG